MRGWMDGIGGLVVQESACEVGPAVRLSGVYPLLCLAKTASSPQVRRAAEPGEVDETGGDVVRRLAGHRDPVVIEEVRREVGIGPGPDAIEGSSESAGGRAASSGRAAGVPVMKTAETR
jgi:hypothetical protein